MSTELILVRHGQTDWNVEGRYQGQAGPGLNERGRRQALEAARKLAGTPVEAVYTSDLPRAFETARIIADVLGAPVYPDERLRELHQGVWQGMLFSDIQTRYAETLRNFREDPVHHSPPGGETVAQLARRITNALDDIASRHPGKRVVVVTHKLPIAIIRSMVAGNPPHEVWNAIPENAQAIIVSWPLQTASARQPDAWLAGGDQARN